MSDQLKLFEDSTISSIAFDIHSYDYYIVLFSGGKDSTALFLSLLDLGIPKSRIELWHHLVDGKARTFMDWECTEDYCRQFANHFGVPIYYSWKNGGFEGEMLRENAFTRPNYYETPKGTFSSGGDRGKRNTRLRFPQVSADLSVRWCSGYLKIDVGSVAINNQKRFLNKRTLVLSGERAEESTARSKYEFFESHRTSSRGRHVDQCRLIHAHQEADVWGIIERYGVVVHPCYYLGYSRCSCKWCIFGSANQFATSYSLSPEQGMQLIEYEDRFGCTIKRDIDLFNLIRKGVPYKGILLYPEIAKQAVSYEYTGRIITDNWILPLGAYGESLGPS